jgi:PTH1 family peptidyl-tRNA hydrolase
MKLIVGLGNYGKEYQKTKHNYGFMVIDEFAKRNNFPEFKLNFFSLLSIKNNIIIAKPQTYMNNSGKAVKAISNYYKILPEEIVIVHDDVDIKLGEIKEDQDRGSAGHNGIKSIIENLGTKNFKRIRMGINSEKLAESLENEVLKDFDKEDFLIVSEKIEDAIKIINKLCKE